MNAKDCVALRLNDNIAIFLDKFITHLIKIILQLFSFFYSYYVFLNNNFYLQILILESFIIRINFALFKINF